MTDLCCCPPEAGNSVCELPAQDFSRPARMRNVCPTCGVKGKPVQGQTVKSLLAVSLRQVRQVEYMFCKQATCTVVYFSLDGEQTFNIEQVRERVYQKEPDNGEAFICYCFRYSVGKLQAASPEVRKEIVDNIKSGIHSGQCACDLRNPQGSCCLGNVYGLIKNLETPADKTNR
ncbi:MAG: copper chaperone Copz family protein [Anaerolineales bacterium]|nr:copper chaperone Copz family protein [Anaerolineales bacterium]